MLFSLLFFLLWRYYSNLERFPVFGISKSLLIFELGRPRKVFLWPRSVGIWATLYEAPAGEGIGKVRCTESYPVHNEAFSFFRVRDFTVAPRPLLPQ